MRVATTYRFARLLRPSLSRACMTAIAVTALSIGGCASPNPRTQTPQDVEGAGGGQDPIAGTSQPTTVDVVAPKPPQKFELGLFTADELFEAGSGGCGMALTPAREVLEDSTAPGDLLLFHSVDGSPMLMKINGELVPFTLEEGRGEAFYGQTLSQTFSNADLNLIAVVDVDPGEEGELESIDIPSGSLQLQAGSETIAIPVEGDAGC